MTDNKSILKDVLKKFKKQFYAIGLFSFLINILMLVPPIYMLQLYDRVLHSKSQDTLLMLTLIVVILFITMGLLEIVRSRLLIKIGNGIDNNLSNNIYDCLFELEKLNPKEANTAYVNNLTQIRQFITSNGIFAFFDAPWISIYLLILFLFHPYFGYFALFTIFILFILTFVNEIFTKGKLNEASTDNINSNTYLDACLKNADVINSMGMKENIRTLWKNKYYSFLNAQNDASEHASIWSNISKNFRLLAQSLILGLGAYLAIKSEVSAGMIIASSIIMGRALAPLDLLISTWKNFISYRNSYKRIDSLLKQFSKKEKKTLIPISKAVVSLENVVIAPPLKKENLIIKDISFEINSGDIVAIIGNSGTGKSTLLKGILDIWPLSKGIVKIDNIDIRLLNKEKIGSKIGYLPQDIELFEGTISENICRFQNFDSNKIVEATKIAGVHKMILKFPEAYDTNIGYKNTLSGGQRQRIGLARAIYDNPKLVILDEPNSNLDKEGENALLEAIINLKKNNTTVIIVTHKENILKVTNKIALIEDGKLKEYGDTNSVLNKYNFFKLDN